MKLGYRGWRIRQSEFVAEGLQPILISPYRDIVWPVDGLKAECPGAPTAEQREQATVGVMAEHMKSCTCGIYALKTPEEVARQYSSDIIGEVLLYGDIIEGDRGFRASEAMVGALFMPKELKEPNDLLKSVARHYGVPLTRALEYSSEFYRERLVIDDSLLGNIRSMRNETDILRSRQTWDISMIIEDGKMLIVRPGDNVEIKLSKYGECTAVVTKVEYTARMPGLATVDIELVSQSALIDRVSRPNCRCVIMPVS